MESFDPGVIRQLRDELPPETLRDILRSFESDLSRLATELTEAARAGRRDAYLRAAHSLAGAASAVGLVGLEREARLAMDPIQREGPAAVMPRLLAEASHGLDALRAEIG